MSARVRGKRGTLSKPETRKPGFYSRVLDAAERLDFELASGVEGIDGEIALEICVTYANGSFIHQSLKPLY